MKFNPITIILILGLIISLWLNMSARALLDASNAWQQAQTDSIKSYQSALMVLLRSVILRHVLMVLKLTSMLPLLIWKEELSLFVNSSWVMSGFLNSLNPTAPIACNRALGVFWI